MVAAAELVGRLAALQALVPAPSRHPIAGVAAEAWVARERIADALAAAKEAGYFFESLTAVDRLEAHGVFELIYTVNRWDAPSRLALRVWARPEEPVPTASRVFGAADWNEREAWEFFGVRFDGHPNLTRLLLPDDADFFPLLKSFTAPPPSPYDDSLKADAATADASSPAESG